MKKEIICSIGVIICTGCAIRLIHYVLGSYFIDAIFLLAFLWPLIGAVKILISGIKRK